MRLPKVAGLVGVIVMLVTVAGCSGSGSGGSSADTLPEAAQAALVEHPGYTHASDDGRAVLKLMAAGEEGYPECTATTCKAVKAFAPVGCSSLYVGANLLNASGDVVASTSSSAAAITVDGEAVLQFTAEIEGSDTWEITEILCR